MPVQTQTQNYIQNSIRDSLLNSHHTAAANAEDNDSLQNKLISNAKRILTKSIEYEEVDPYTTAQFNGLKDKYTVLNGGQGNYNNMVGGAKLQSGEKAASSQGANGVPAGSQLPQPKRVLFSRDDVQIGWKASGRRWQVGAGMMNVGNTCYLNSTLQAVFHVPAMANWLMSDAKHRESCEDDGGGQNGCIICAMARTLMASQSTQSAIKPWKVYTKLRLVCKHLTLGRQEDAHEFLRYLIESMEKLYLGRFKNSKDLDQYSKETTPLNQILGGYLRSAVKCLSCQHVSTTYQHFQDLLLDIRKANSVEEALDGYFARERLEDMGYKCEACKKRVSATKQFTLERAPIALCIQLKRFSMMGSKLNKHVQIKQRLDMSAYASQSLKKSTDKLNYRLVSMVTHLGSSQNCGHYTAIGLHESGSYYQFDDSCVRPISIQSVMNTNAYIIFYELEDGARAASSSTMTSSSVYMNENVNGMNGANNKRPHDNGLASTSSQYHNNNKFNGNNSDANRSNFIGPQLPQQQQQQTKRDDTPSPMKSSKPNAISLSEYANRKQTKPENGGNDSAGSSPFNFNRTLKLTENGGNGMTNGLPAKHDKLVIHFKNNKAENHLKSPTVTIGHASPAKSPVSVKKAITFGGETNEVQLPSMPTLINGTPEGPNKQKNNTTTPTKSTLPTTATPTKATPPTTATVSPNTKRLVPYESDDSDDEAAPHKNGNTNNGYSTTSSLSAASNDDDIVQTKAGQFQVSDSSIKRPSKHGSTSKSSYSVQDGSPPNNKPVTNFNHNGAKNGQQNGYTGNGNTVNGLLKMSYRGYGSAGVQTWNGERSTMDAELLQEKRDEQRRKMNSDEEDDAEMDRGRVKKVKTSHSYNNNYNGNGNGGYNPFQDQQNRQFNGNGGYQQRNDWNEPSHRNFNKGQQNGNHKSSFYNRPNQYNNNGNFNRNNNFRGHNHNKRVFHNNYKYQNRRGGGNQHRGNFSSRY